MSEFKREERYRVIKLKTGSAIDCVVVEADWPEYETMLSAAPVPHNAEINRRPD